MIEWFVIYNNEHVGPFAENVLHHLYEEGDFAKETLVWREGMENPVSYEDQFLLSKKEKEFIPLQSETIEGEDITWDTTLDAPPEFAFDTGDDSSNTQKIQEIQTEDMNEVDEDTNVEQRVFLDEQQETLVTDQADKEDNEKSGFNENTVEEPIIIKPAVKKSDLIKRRNKGKPTYEKKLKVIFLIVVLAAISFFPIRYYLDNSFQTFTRPEQMSIIDYNRLKDISLYSGKKNVFAFAISKDRSKIWLSTNNPYEGNIVIKLRSVKEKTLTNKNIEATSRAYLHGKLATFDSWTFTSGIKLEDGYYNIEAYTTKDLDVPIYEYFFSKRKKQFRFFNEVLVSQLSKENFNKELKKIKNKMTRNDLAFWQELKQKYKTIRSITAQIKGEIDKAFSSDNANWKQELSLFEVKYKSELGSFFTNFVIQNDRSYNELKTREFTNKTIIISNYYRLSTIAKEVGEVTMDIFKEMETFDGIDDARKELIWNKAQARLTKIIKMCDSKMDFIQGNK